MVEMIHRTPGTRPPSFRSPLDYNLREMAMASRARGFTLPEVLVVIGILAALSGILLPAVSSARRAANTVKCLSNLRQVGITFREYALYFDGKYPVATHEPLSRRLPIPVERHWGDLLGQFVSSVPMEQATDLGLDRNCVLWGCPEWRKSTDFDPASVNDTLKSGYGMNYQPTMFEDGDSSKLAYISVTTGSYDLATLWTKPSDRVLVADSTEHAIGTPNSFSSNGKTARRP
jgi:prepilin-type N-terminal cleavage/methylation domain-containing protein